VADETGIILPRGVVDPRDEPGPANVVIDNRTGLADDVVQRAVETHFVEHSSLNGQQIGSFFTYANEGSLLARRQFSTPGSVIDEIKLARQLAERDDDVGNAIGAALAIAFADGFESYHEDSKTTQLFDGVARFMGGSALLKEMYREYLIAGSVTTVGFPVRTKLPYSTPGKEPSDSNEREESVVALKCGVLPAELIRPLGNDIFGDSDLGYLPGDEATRRWLREFFDPETTPARKAAMRREDPVAAALFMEEVEVENTETLIGKTMKLYRLNPRMAFRTSMPKGIEPHARPLLTRDFALLEAKRLLNIMDYALLQGGSNYIVVAKKGTDERPALPEEVANLTDVVRRASKTGVLVGDHRLSFDIITPDLGGLLNGEKRRLLGRKLAAAVLRLPEQGTPDPGAAGMSAELELLSRVVASDRHDLKEHVERYVYGEVVKRNPTLFKRAEPPKLWFPKIILQGTQFFTDFVLKLRDRGDIPRKFAVQAAGFDWDAGVAQRKAELDAGIDETMAPAAVPFSSPDMGPQDNNPGRPRGTSPDNGAPGARPGGGQDNVRPLRTVNRNAGETVKAVLEGEETYRVGVQTYAILEQYPEREVGRVTPLERSALEGRKPFRTGPLAIIPVNPAYEVGEVRAVRLSEGLSLLVGERTGDHAVVAKALCFRAPQFDVLAAEETALRWGFPIDGWEEMEELARAEAPPAQLPPAVPGPAQTIVVNAAGQRVRKKVIRDEHNNIVAIEEEPLDDEPAE
jgi:hypothetical protein